MVMYSLYCDKTIRNGKTVIKFAKEAPAPITTNKEGKAQQIKVDEDANRDKKFADDKTPKIVAVREALKQDKIIVDGIPDIIIIPQANSPQITAEVMDKGFELLINHNLWEVMSADEKGVQNAAFRIIRTEHISNTFLSAHCGFITANIIDVHSIDDILKLEELL